MHRLEVLPRGALRTELLTALRQVRKICRLRTRGADRRYATYER